MSKYSYEEKLEAVLRVTEEKISTYASAKILGTTQEVVRRWVARYKQFGTEGILSKHGSYTGEFKVSVIEYMHENNESLFCTAVKFGIPCDTTVGKWERIYHEKGPQGLLVNNRGGKRIVKSKKSKKMIILQETEESLIDEVERLRMENECLKKLQALVQKRISQENGNEAPSSTN